MSVNIIHKPVIKEPKLMMYNVTCTNAKCLCKLTFITNAAIRLDFSDHRDEYGDYYITCPKCNQQIPTSSAVPFSKTDYANLDG